MNTFENYNADFSVDLPKAESIIFSFGQCQFHWWNVDDKWPYHWMLYGPRSITEIMKISQSFEKSHKMNFSFEYNFAIRSNHTNHQRNVEIVSQSDDEFIFLASFFSLRYFIVFFFFGVTM